jgi:murein DD-endopeptidase MepM/ murein hydrolase activator NlpD
MMKARLGWTVYGDPEYVPHVLRYYDPYGGVNAQGYGSPFAGKNWREAVSSEYGYRIDPITGKAGAFHDGLDIAYPTGTAINAIAGGTVSRVVRSGSGYGNNVTVDHGNGVTSFYAHCSSILVSEGQAVSRGDVISTVGSTGRSTGPHLHLTVKLSGKLQNPRDYIE